MCGYHGPSYNEIAVTAAILPFLAYDVGIGAFSFYNWSRVKKLQSLKALGIAAAVLCTLGGFAFGAWPNIVPWRGQENFDRAFLMLQVGVAILFFYPAIEFIFSRRKKWQSYLFKLPVALLGVWLGILANQHNNLAFFVLSNGASIWDSWVYQRLLQGPHGVPYY